MRWYSVVSCLLVWSLLLTCCCWKECDAVPANAQATQSAPASGDISSLLLVAGETRDELLKTLFNCKSARLFVPIGIPHFYSVSVVFEHGSSEVCAQIQWERKNKQAIQNVIDAIKKEGTSVEGPSGPTKPKYFLIKKEGTPSIVAKVDDPDVEQECWNVRLSLANAADATTMPTTTKALRAGEKGAPRSIAKIPVIVGLNREGFEAYVKASGERCVCVEGAPMRCGEKHVALLESMRYDWDDKGIVTHSFGRLLHDHDPGEEIMKAIKEKSLASGPGLGGLGFSLLFPCRIEGKVIYGLFDDMGFRDPNGKRVYVSVARPSAALLRAVTDVHTDLESTTQPATASTTRPAATPPMEQNRKSSLPNAQLHGRCHRTAPVPGTLPRFL